jgi:hypothetical protein
VDRILLSPNYAMNASFLPKISAFKPTLGRYNAAPNAARASNFISARPTFPSLQRNFTTEAPLNSVRKLQPNNTPKPPTNQPSLD